MLDVKSSSQKIKKKKTWWIFFPRIVQWLCSVTALKCHSLWCCLHTLWVSIWTAARLSWGTCSQALEVQLFVPPLKWVSPWVIYLPKQDENRNSKCSVPVEACWNLRIGQTGSLSGTWYFGAALLPAAWLLGLWALPRYFLGIKGCQARAECHSKREMNQWREFLFSESQTKSKTQNTELLQM